MRNHTASSARPPSWGHLLYTSPGGGIELRPVPPALGAQSRVEAFQQAVGGLPDGVPGLCSGPFPCSEEEGSEPRGSLAEETGRGIWGGRAAELGGTGGIPSDLPQGSGRPQGADDVGKHFAARLVQSQGPEHKGS